MPRGRALLRSGARARDLLYVSGELGGARFGLEHPSQSLRQRRPEPRVRLGLVAREFASAAIDLSDGLAQDLGHLCRASGVGAEVELGRLPLAPPVRRALGGRAASFTLAGGEDYELLLAVPRRRASAFEAAARRAKEKVRCVGVLTAERSIVFCDPEGQVVPPPAGFDHFAPDRRLQIDRPPRRK